MIHLTRSLVRRWLDVLLHIEDSPERTAAAFAIGIFFGFSPFLGVHTLLALIVATSHASKQVFRIDLHVASPRDSQRVDSHLISYADTSAVTNLLTSAVHELLTCIHTHAASRSRNSGYCKDLVLLNPRRWLAQVPVRVQSPLHAGHGKSPVRFAPEGQFDAHNLPDHLHPEVPPTCGRVRELNR